MIHSTLDFQTGAYNDQFNIFDNNPFNNNDGSDGEPSFGLFERQFDGGPITAKAAAYVFSAYQGNYGPSASLFPRSVSNVLDEIRIRIGFNNDEFVDLSGLGGGFGLTDGWIALAKGGDDTVLGSAFSDSLFLGDGEDSVSGNAGNDRIYGGAANDQISGNDGDDDLYGNTGDDALNPGAGFNRADGGTGYDTLVLDGASSDYQLTGDGRFLSVNGNGTSTNAINLEAVLFVGDGVTQQLSNIDVTIGNGLDGGTGGPPPPPPPPSGETLFFDEPQTQWLAGTTTQDVFVIPDTSQGYGAGPTLDGTGIVVWNGPKFDILTDFETIRFTDRDVERDAQGRFLITPGDALNYGGGGQEALQFDEPQTQWAFGTGANDVFVYSESSAGFQSSLTEDGQAIVVWNGAKFDILDGFEALRFTDRDVAAGDNGVFDFGNGSQQPGETVVQDDPGTTQYLTGGSGTDVFAIDANASEYGVAPTLDGTGTVVWRGADFDVLNDFEFVRFNDTDVVIG